MIEETMEPIYIGSIVVSRCGRDKDVVFAVVGTVESENGKTFALISDGRFHTLEQPKKKNPIHLQTMCSASPRILAAMEEGSLNNRRLFKILGETQHQA